MYLNRLLLLLLLVVVVVVVVVVSSSGSGGGSSSSSKIRFIIQFKLHNNLQSSADKRSYVRD